MKIKKRRLYIAVAVLAFIAAALAFTYFYPLKKETAPLQNQSEERIDGYVDSQGYLHYPLDRGEISFKRENYSESAELLVSKVIFQSRRGNIYGLLVLPKKAGTDLLPAVVLLPGAGVSKESELPVAEEIAKMGYAVLTIDQRGVGETNQKIPSLEQDFQIFASRQEPYSHLVVYDALRAFDLLRSAPFVDKDRIIMAGESIGGRIAIIASVVDDSIKGTLAISAAGYQINVSDPYADIFFKSINPDRYVKFIAPRKFAMIHNAQDKNIRFESALRTFEMANEPKELYTINTTKCNHGYCDEMKDEVRKALEYLVS